jgi:hypothetical protein
MHCSIAMEGMAKREMKEMGLVKGKCAVLWEYI